jgi:hypothetical protein
MFYRIYNVLKHQYLVFISTFWYLGGRFDKHNSLMPNFASLKKLQIMKTLAKCQISHKKHIRNRIKLLYLSQRPSKKTQIKNLGYPNGLNIFSENPTHSCIPSLGCNFLVAVWLSSDFKTWIIFSSLL